MEQDKRLRPMAIGRQALRERQVEEELVQAVKNAGGFCLKLDPHGARGVPDRIVIAPGGRAIMVELKRPAGGRLSPIQKRWRDSLTDSGIGWLRVKDKSDIESVVLWVRAAREDIRRAERGEGHGAEAVPGGSRQPGA